MADITIKTGDVFPDGTSVRAYLQSQIPEPGGVPGGSSSATATATNGLVSFTGLADGTAYVAYASVSGQNRTRKFFTNVVTVSSGGGGGSVIVAATDPPSDLPAGTIYAKSIAGVTLGVWVVPS